MARVENDPITPPRTESYVLKQGTGRIAVRGDRAACGLFLDNRPFMFNWADCAGSIGQDLYRFRKTRENEAIRDLVDIASKQPHKHEVLSQLILPLLRQFSPATYLLTLSQMAPGEQLEECPGSDDAESDRGYSGGYYPERDGIYGGTVLLMTQPWESLDQDRIAHFWYAIEDGDRPFAITAGVDGGMCEFVLDGHHKLVAYNYAKIPAWRLCITTPSPPLMESDWPQTFGMPLSWRKVHGW